MRFLACLSVLSLAACGEPSVAPQPQTPHVEPVAAQPAPEAPPAPTEAPPPASRLGKVLEVLDGGERYTYARMDACGAEAWVAGPKGTIEVGKTLTMVGGAGMENFKSEKLKRTFEQILFVDSWSVSPKEMDCTPRPKVDLDDLVMGKVTEKDGGAGYTFVKLTHCGADTWLAGPETPVRLGDNVAASKGSVMKKFHADSIGKTFDEIMFVQKFQKANALPPCK